MFYHFEEPNFDQVVRKTSDIWGTHLQLALPKYEQGHEQGHDNFIGELRSTLNVIPGKESLRFYDDLYTASEPEFFNVSPSSTFDKDRCNDAEVERLSQRDDLIALRRFFTSNFECTYGEHVETWYCDLFINLNEVNGNLLEPDNLKRAHHDLWRVRDQVMAQSDISVEHGDVDFFSDPEPIEGVNWSSNEFNGLMWQGFSEYYGRDGYLFGLSWLIPLGKYHYLQVRFYRLNNQFYQEFQNAFVRFTENCMQRLTIEPPQEVSDYLRSGGWCFSNAPFYESGVQPPLWYKNTRDYEAFLAASNAEQKSIEEDESLQGSSINDGLEDKDTNAPNIEIRAQNSIREDRHKEWIFNGLGLVFMLWVISVPLGLYVIYNGDYVLPLGIENNSVLSAYLGIYLLYQLLGRLHKRLESAIAT